MDLNKVNIKADKFVTGQVDAFIAGYELACIIIDERGNSVPKELQKGYVDLQKTLLTFREEELSTDQIFEIYEETIQEQMTKIQAEKKANEEAESKIVLPGKQIKVASDEGMMKHDEVFHGIPVTPK